MKYLFLFCLLLIQSCGLFRPIHSGRTTQISEKTDSVLIAIPQVEIKETQTVVLSDTIFIDTPEFSIEIIQLPKTSSGKDSTKVTTTVKAKTDTVKVAQKTVTINNQDTYIKKETPWYTWLLIGALILIILLVLLKRN